ncbi:hypothetical protein OG627_11795 [Streptomyces sp. NBC_01429]|uniref:hypothetical protein n=1 Tax=Streptomyces sp. NPDC091212 TaxID=3155191 RepID=UPI002E2D24C3|nr:hypothetical protein [Streptomyces sp. NBC_01429]
MGAVGRRPLAWVAAIVLLLEGVGAVFVNGVLATVAGNQRMSLAGLDPDAMVVGTWVTGGVLGLYLALCAGLLVRTALRDRAPGLFGRILLITCAVAHGVLAALAVGLVGWDAFAFMMVVAGLLVLILLGYGSEPGRRPAAPA